MTDALGGGAVCVDMTVFPTAGHLTSCAGRCPGNDQSAGKRRSGRTRKGSKWLGIALEEAALVATRSKGSDYFQKRDPERATKRLVAKLQELGHAVILEPAAA